MSSRLWVIFSFSGSVSVILKIRNKMKKKIAEMYSERYCLCVINYRSEFLDQLFHSQEDDLFLDKFY